MIGCYAARRTPGFAPLRNGNCNLGAAGEAGNASR